MNLNVQPGGRRINPKRFGSGSHKIRKRFVLEICRATKRFGPAGLGFKTNRGSVPKKGSASLLEVSEQGSASNFQETPPAAGQP